MGIALRRSRLAIVVVGGGTEDLPLTGSKKSRAALSPAFAPWSPSGAKRIVAPLEPPVLVSLSYLRHRQRLSRSRAIPGLTHVPLQCHANLTSTGP